MKKKSLLFEFVQNYSNEEACYALLFSYKWKNGYQCRKCGCRNEVKGRTCYHKRCKRCHYDESCTAHTVFHKLKFPINKAFSIIFQLATMKKGMSSCEISRQYGIHQETAWFFARKVQLYMKKKNDTQLDQYTRISLQLIASLSKEIKGNQSEGRLSRSKIVETRSAQNTNQRTRKEFRKTRAKSSFLRSDPNELAKIMDREKRGARTLHFIKLSCDSLEKIWPIFRLYNLRNWLVGIYHKVSVQHIKQYFSEFLFKLQNKKQLRRLPFLIIQRFIENSQTPYKSIVAP